MIEIKYTRRKNLGNHNHEELTISKQIEDGANLLEASIQLKTEVCSLLDELAIFPDGLRNNLSTEEKHEELTKKHSNDIPF